ncbi:DUF2243 domain-containing protein [Geminicoccus harenae]|uniref:DUF2243 domain-containing protein n=1 Tax=Geminicoccus harenae TaxID=2498453 RepID=UPI00168BEA38|nr:DUF2243 domain-containing protein [Geminicoccus harenae]
MWSLPWTRYGAILGFSLGGFFDGILLHQILQWHHLLSLVPGVADLRAQVLWDGYFHALMYVIAIVGLWGLWRAHRSVEGGRGRPLLSALLVGFGLWHVADAVLSHWLLGIHRIKLDSESPLLWDLIWLVAFGVVPLVAGWALARGGGAGPTKLQHSALVMLLLTFATAGAGAWALRPPPDQPFTTVVFRPDYGTDQIFAALSSLDARLVWSDPMMSVVVVDVQPERRWRLYQHGALLVSGSGVPAGCFAWSTV